MFVPTNSLKLCNRQSVADPASKQADIRNSNIDPIGKSKLSRSMQSHMPERVHPVATYPSRWARQRREGVIGATTAGCTNRWPVRHSCLHSDDAFVLLLPSLLLHAVLQMSAVDPSHVHYCVARFILKHLRDQVHHSIHGLRHDLTSGTGCDGSGRVAGDPHPRTRKRCIRTDRSTGDFQGKQSRPSQVQGNI